MKCLKHLVSIITAITINTNASSCLFPIPFVIPTAVSIESTENMKSIIKKSFFCPLCTCNVSFHAFVFNAVYCGKQRLAAFVF